MILSESASPFYHTGDFVRRLNADCNAFAVSSREHRQSPRSSNSSGHMDRGIDLAYRDFFGVEIKNRLQARI